MDGGPPEALASSKILLNDIFARGVGGCDLDNRKLFEGELQSFEGVQSKWLRDCFMLPSLHLCLHLCLHLMLQMRQDLIGLSKIFTSASLYLDSFPLQPLLPQALNAYDTISFEPLRNYKLFSCRPTTTLPLY